MKGDSTTGFPTEWFLRPPENFICGICLEVLRDPHQCKSGHLFCLSCIESALSNDIKKCPSCDESLKLKHMGRSLCVKNLINELKVKCGCHSKNISSSCHWTGTLTERLTRECHPKRTVFFSGKHVNDERTLICNRCEVEIPTSGVQEHSTTCRRAIKTSSDKKRKSRFKPDVEPSVTDFAEVVIVSGVATKPLTTLPAPPTATSPPIIVTVPVLSAARSSTPLTPLHCLKLHDGTYIGDVRNRKRHGQGKMAYTTGDVYQGQWVDDRREGRGVKTYADAERYDGQWKSDLRHGNGKATTKRGEVFTGQWKDGKKHREGSTKYPNGMTVSSVWTNGIEILKDKVTVKYADGGEYIGHVRGSMRHGSGEMTYPTGNVYSGSWSDDHRSGNGTYKRTDGTKYDGDWFDDKQHGAGVVTVTDGTSTANEWLNGRPQVTIVKEFSVEGGLYSGGLKDGLPHLQGHMQYANGDLYVGQWVAGRREGGGSLWCVLDGSVYTGAWRNDKPCGLGSVRLSTGRVLRGVWGHGTKLYANGCFYEGDFVNDMRHGSGTISYPSVVSGQPSQAFYTGQWSEDRKCGQGTEVNHAGSSYVGQYVFDLRHGQGTVQHTDGSFYCGQWYHGLRWGRGVELDAAGGTYRGLFEGDVRHGQGQNTFADGSVFEGVWIQGVPMTGFIIPV